MLNLKKYLGVAILILLVVFKIHESNFVKRIENLVNCKVDIISTGPERDENIIINKVFS